MHPLPAERQSSVPVGFFWKLRPHGAAVVTVPYWCTGAILLMVLGWTAGKLLPMAWSRALGLRMVHYAFAGYTAILRYFDIIRLEFVGFEKWPADGKGQILAANHPAIWDAVFLLGRIPGLTCVLKASLLTNPLTSGGAKLAGFIPGTPPLEMTRRCVDAVKAGENLLLFPEATRTRRESGLLNPMKSAVGIISQHANAPIWPAVIETDTLYLGKSWHPLRPPTGPTTVRITLLDPILPDENTTSREMVERLQGAFLSILSRTP